MSVFQCHKSSVISDIQVDKAQSLVFLSSYLSAFSGLEKNRFLYLTVLSCYNLGHDIFQKSPEPQLTMVAMSLPMDYGYVISAGVGAIFMVMWKGVRVGMVSRTVTEIYQKYYLQMSPL